MSFRWNTYGICLSCQENYFLQCFSLEELIKRFNSIYNKTTLDEIKSFLESYSLNNTICGCTRCPVGCKTCYNPNNTLENNIQISTSCNKGYKLINGQCKWQCNVGDSEYCLTCDLGNITGRCASCNPYYYLNETTGKCLSCGIKNCIKCKNKNECLECRPNYILSNNQCVKSCEIGLNEKCKKCNDKEGHFEECIFCNDGYFLPNDTNKQKCVKCPDGCLSCYGSTDNIFCSSCKSCYELINRKCQLLSNLGELIEMCLDCDYNEIPFCSKCQSNAYLNKDKKCIICGQNIAKCHEENNEIIIDECEAGFYISGKQCLKYCIKGSTYQCLTCKKPPENIDECEECNMGFFMPKDSIDKTKCEKCTEIGCLKCSGTIENNVCTECHEDYKLYEGKCIKNCEIGENEKCLKCDKNEGRNNRCSECNSGYYLPEYSSDENNNIICKKCPLDCLECHSNYDNQICTKCENNYLLKDGKCIKGCYYLLRQNCLNCNEDEGYPICTECKSEYYFPLNRNQIYEKCYKCSMIGCDYCEGETEYNNECLSCKDGYNPIMEKDNIVVKSCSKQCEIGDKNKCKSCSDESNSCGQCNDEFELSNGICIMKEYDIYAEYQTTEENEYINIMNHYCVEKLEMNGVYYESYSSIINIQIKKPGIYTAKIKLKNYCSFASLFSNNKNLKSIIFFDNFNSKSISLMNNCFTNCPNLEYVDLSNLDLSNNGCFMNFFSGNKKLKEVKFPKKEAKNAYYMYGMFNGCESLTSVDMSTIYNNRAVPMYSMFKGCSQLETIKINNFKNVNVDINNMLDGLPEEGTIILSKEFEEKIKYQIPSKWKVEIEDDE